jgi:hypothetical protein
LYSHIPGDIWTYGVTIHSKQSGAIITQNNVKEQDRLHESDVDPDEPDDEELAAWEEELAQIGSDAADFGNGDGRGIDASEVQDEEYEQDEPGQVRAAGREYGTGDGDLGEGSGEERQAPGLVEQDWDGDAARLGGGDAGMLDGADTHMPLGLGANEEMDLGISDDNRADNRHHTRHAQYYNQQRDLQNANSNDGSDRDYGFGDGYEGRPEDGAAYQHLSQPEQQVRDSIPLFQLWVCWLLIVLIPSTMEG